MVAKPVSDKSLKIFAPENEAGEMQVQVNAVEQMERCLEHPAAVAGALMAAHR
jgi:hypothetical protein